MSKLNEIEELREGEYPPKYVGTKGNGETKMVYRIDGEMGLTWFQERNYRTMGYRWEHFDLIEKDK
jgi:hypothetical protein